MHLSGTSVTLAVAEVWQIQHSDHSGLASPSPIWTMGSETIRISFSLHSIPVKSLSDPGAGPFSLRIHALCTQEK